MSHRSSSKQLEAWGDAGVLSLLGVWVVGFLSLLGAYLGLMYLLVPGLFIWLLIGG